MNNKRQNITEIEVNCNPFSQNDLVSLYGGIDPTVPPPIVPPPGL